MSPEIETNPQVQYIQFLEDNQMNKKLLYFVFICLILLVSCNKIDEDAPDLQDETYNYATDEPFIIVSSSIAGPDTIINFYPTIISIDVDGNVKLYSETYNDVIIQDDAPTVETTIDASKVADIQERLEAYHFLKKSEDISDDNSVDGDFNYITLNLTDDSKTVGGLNTLDEDFLAIFNEVSSIIEKKDKAAWAEEIKQHIVEVNPDVE